MKIEQDRHPFTGEPLPGRYTVTLARDEGRRFTPGMAVVFEGRARWWKRLLWWLRILKRPRPVTVTISDVDYANGTITVE